MSGDSTEVQPVEADASTRDAADVALDQAAQAAESSSAGPDGVLSDTAALESEQRALKPNWWARNRLRIHRTTGVISGAMVVAVCVGLTLAYQPLQSKAATLNATQPQVQFDWPPLRSEVSSAPHAPGEPPRTWVNSDIRADLEKLALGNLGTDPFDRDALARARTALNATGWFQQDLKLRRDQSGLVHIAGSWRIPAAAVRSGGKDIIVSAQGERLPVDYRPDTSGFRVIVGARSGPPEFGQGWLGGDVQAGLRLLTKLSTLDDRSYSQIAAIDVTDYSVNRTLVIITELGNRIIWGGPVEDFSPGQAQPSVKLARLVQLQREHGRVDAGRAAIDVRLLDGVYVLDTHGSQTRYRELQAAASPEKSSRRNLRR